MIFARRVSIVSFPLSMAPCVDHMVMSTCSIWPTSPGYGKSIRQRHPHRDVVSVDFVDQLQKVSNDVVHVDVGGGNLLAPGIGQQLASGVAARSGGLQTSPIWIEPAVPLEMRTQHFENPKIQDTHLLKSEQRLRPGYPASIIWATRSCFSCRFLSVASRTLRFAIYSRGILQGRSCNFS